MNLWDVFVDVSIFATLLLIGQILRAKIKFLQKILVPASLIGGFIGLALGPNGFNVLPFSKSISTYAAILIVFVFAAMPIGDVVNKEKLENVGGMFFNITGIVLAQYLFGLVICLFVLNKIWPDLNDGFGLLMATGFYGGHGTAAAVGSAYAEMGWKEFTDLGMFSATFGIVSGIVFGMMIINWGTRKGYTNYVTSPKDLPEELRTGLIPPEKQKQGGKITVSSISIDPLAFHICLVLIPSLAGHFLSKFIKAKITWLSIPAFCLSLAFAFVMQSILNKTGGQKYVDRQTINRISGTCTDFLIVSGIASVKLSVVADNFVPLMITFIGGLLLNWVWFLFIGKHSSRKDWFERNMMVWGHATGVVATGVLLQRVVDPDLKSRGIEDSGISDIFNRPIVIGLQVLPPILLAQGTTSGRMITMGSIAAILLVFWVIAWKLKWWDLSINRD